MRPGVFFDLEDEMTVNLTAYWNQILTKLLKKFWIEYFRDIKEPIVMEDNVSIYKTIDILVKKELGMRYHQHQLNFSDFNSIENI